MKLIFDCEAIVVGIYRKGYQTKNTWNWLLFGHGKCLFSWWKSLCETKWGVDYSSVFEDVFK